MEGADAEMATLSQFSLAESRCDVQHPFFAREPATARGRSVTSGNHGYAANR